MTLHKGKVRMNSYDHVEGTPYVDTGINLCRLSNGLRCMGCCGFDFAPKSARKNHFITALQESTKEFKQYDDKLEYKKRYDPEDLHDCGLCRQMVLEEGDDELSFNKLFTKKHLKFTCPLHPAQNDGKELRIGECDPAFMCQTQRMFLEEWSDWMKEKFIAFIEAKDPDWYTYSKNMHNNTFLKEFYEYLE
ncbi:MAG: hypothetical protein ACMXYK_04540 [Candidatus Woesearchaeota archaeon]